MRIGRSKESLYNTRVRVENKAEWDIATKYYLSHGFEFYSNPEWLKPYNYNGYIFIEKAYNFTPFIIAEANSGYSEINKFKDITDSVIYKINK